MAALDNIASELLKSANEADLIYKRTRDQAQRDKAVRLRRIVENLRNLSSGTSTLDQVTTAGNTTANTINVGGITTDYVQLDTAATPTPVQGMMFWDSDRSTVDVQLDADVSAKVGQDNFWYVKNQSGATIPKGKAVMAVGTLGSSGRILIDEMVANGSISSKFLLGITAEDIANGADGFVMNIGKLRQVNTTIWPDGTVLYCDPTTAGNLTSTKPSSPNLALPVAFVVHSAANGVLAIRVSILDENAFNTPTLAQVTTAGNTTTNAITVGGLTVATNLIYTDTVNGRVGIGTTSPAYKIDVVGGIRAATGTSIFKTVNNGQIVMSDLGDSQAALLFADNNGYPQYGNIKFYDLSFRNGSATVGKIFSTGNWGINTTTDAGYKLDVNGTARVVGPTFRVGDSTKYFEVYTDGSGYRQLRLFSSGNFETTLVSTSGGGLSLYNSGVFSGGFVASTLQIKTVTSAGFSTYEPLNFDSTLFPANTTTAAYSFRVFTSSGSGITVKRLQMFNGDNGKIVLQETGGNVLIGTTTDGTAKLTVAGSITAASALAQGVYFNNTLVAAANNDVLVGLDINPTFTNGAFTGVDNWDLRTKGKVLVSSTTTGNVFPLVVRSTNYPGILLQSGSTGTNHSAALYDGFAFWINYDVSHAKGLITNYENNGISIYNGTNPAVGLTIFGSTNNVAINTTTDAGYKLDVNGTARVQTSLEIVSSAGLTFGGGATALSWAGGGQLSVGNSATWTNIRFYSGLVEKYTQTTTLTTITNTTINLATSTVQLGGINALTYSGTDIRIGSVAAYFNSLSLYVAGSEKARIDSSGNFGLGTTTPTELLHIVNNTNGNKFARISAGAADASAAWVAQNDQVDNIVYRVFGSGVSGTQMGVNLARSASLIANLGGTGKFLIGTYSATDLVFGTNDQERMRLVNNTGNFLIGTTVDAGTKLNVSGDVNALGYRINGVVGYTGILNIPGNPPGQQNVDIQGGIIINIF